MYERTSAGKEPVLCLSVQGPKGETFNAAAGHCEETNLKNYAPQAKVKVDFRVVKNPQRWQMLVELNCQHDPSRLEEAVPGTMLEHATVNAAIMEIRCRVKVEGLMVLPPSTCVALTIDETQPTDLGGEFKAFIREIHDARVVHCCINAALHYTFVEAIRTPGTIGSWDIIYMDPLEHYSAACAKNA